MKAVILAGGLGTRLSEETEVKPKPMVEIGGHPILWHIMKHYSHYGIKEFVIALGYKGEEVKRFFIEYSTLNAGAISINLATGESSMKNKESEDWMVHLVDTGLRTNTGGRVKRLEPWIKNEPFLLTYGDGVSNVNLRDLIGFHKEQTGVCTVTAVRPPARFGGINFNGKQVARFTEKPQTEGGWINGGFMCFEPEVFRYLEDDQTNLEHHVLEALAEEGKLTAYRHEGFWQCMDTLRDKQLLEDLWRSGNPPWRTWN